MEFQWKPLAKSLDKFWIESLYEFVDFVKASLDLDFFKYLLEKFMVKILKEILADFSKKSFEKIVD